MSRPFVAQGGVLQLSLTVGILYSYVLGRFLEWELLAMACLVGGVLLVAASQFAVESPRWLLLSGRKLEALQALLKLRGPNFRVTYTLLLSSCFLMQCQVLSQK